MRSCDIRGSKRALLKTPEPGPPPRWPVVREGDTRSKMEIVWIEVERYAVTVRIRGGENVLKMEGSGSFVTAAVSSHRAPLQK